MPHSDTLPTDLIAVAMGTVSVQGLPYLQAHLPLAVTTCAIPEAKRVSGDAQIDALRWPKEPK